MPPAPTLTALECLRCRAVYDDQRLFTGCPRCARESVNVNLSVVLDHGALGPLTPASFPATPRSLWRFRQLLPLGDAEPVSLGEGATPLVHLQRLGRRLGLPRLYAKDESQNPTWSYKDRLCSLAVTHAVATGARVITISSTGNHGASTAAYAARAGLPCVIFTVASVPDTMKTLMQAYGAAVVACPTSESRWTLDEGGHRAARLVSHERLVGPAHRLEPVRHRGLQDDRVRDRRGSRLDGAGHRRRAELLQRRALRHLEGLGRAARPRAREDTAAHARRRAVWAARPCAGARPRGARESGGGIVRGLLDRLALRDVPGAGGAEGVGRPRRADHRRGHLRSAARARGRGGHLRRALGHRRAHRGDAARPAAQRSRRTRSSPWS